MTVLLNCLSSRSGGALSYLRNVTPLLADELRTLGVGLTLLASRSQAGLFPASLEVRWVEPAPPDLSGLRRYLWETSNVPGIVQRGGYRVLFTPYQIGPRGPGARRVAMVRNMEPFFHGQYPYTLEARLRNRLLYASTRRYLARADHVIAVSNFARQTAQAHIGIPDARISTIHHGRDQTFCAQPGTDDQQILEELHVDRPYVFSCGSLLPYRRVEDVIDAFHTLHAEVAPDSLLVLAGTGSDRRYVRTVMQRVAGSPVGAAIRYLGQVPPAAMRVLYRRARVFVMATEIEACPNIAIEALSSGCAVLAADTAVGREMFADAADYYERRAVPELASRLRNLWQSESRQEAMRGAALRRAMDFSWEACARSTATLLAAEARRA